MNPELTICSVAYESRTCMEQNWRLTRSLNPEVAPTWIVVENSNPGSEERLRPGDGPFLFLEGGDYPAEAFDGSHHHGYGLNRAFEHARTRFVLLQDPDFFILKKDWIRVLIQHMIETGLSFFGVPYYPSRLAKYRYFPCATCMLIDLDRIPRGELDFRPDNPIPPEVARRFEQRARGEWGELTPLYANDLGADANHSTTVEAPAQHKPRLGLKSALRRSISLPPGMRQAVFGAGGSLGSFLRRNHVIGGCRDVGFRLYEEFAPRPDVRSECVVPVYRTASQDKDIFQRIAEPLLPDHWCFVPKRKGYYATSGFRELGTCDLDSLGWEEYLWQGEPFGFHIRGFSQGTRKVEQENLVSTVRSFMNGCGEPDADLVAGRV